MTLARTPMKRRRRNTGPDTKTQVAVYTRTHGRCGMGCGEPATQIHHRRPRRMGGTTDPADNRCSNLIALCTDCHTRIESHRRWALDAGLLLHADEDPRLVPLLTGSASVWLCDDGTVSLDPPTTEENEQ